MRAKTKTCFSLEDPDHQSSHSAAAALIGSNDDLLIQILVCLPVKPFFRFKCVSKQWMSLLSHPTFTLRYETKHFRHKSPIGFFINTKNQYVPFDDDEDQTTPHLDHNIIQSCNGLLLCSKYFGDNYDRTYYVLNPTTRQFVIIPSVPGGKTVRFMGLAFNQTASAHYKVVCILQLNEKLVWEDDGKFQIQTYSSDTSEWKISVKFFYARFPISDGGFYWNGAVYWALFDRSIYMYFKFDVEQLQSLPLPGEAMSLKIRRAYLGESGGHLHCIDHESNSLNLKVYEMPVDHSGWFVKYQVDFDVPGPFPRKIGVSVGVIDVIRGEDDEDTFIVLLIGKKLIMYNVHNKSFKQIYRFNYNYGRSVFYRYAQTLASV